MILHSEKKVNVTSHLGHAAKRQLDRILSTIYQSDSKEWMAKHLNQSYKKNVLHLNCGNGCESRMIASLLDDHSTLLALDDDAVLIEEAKNGSVNSTTAEVSFLQSDPLHWNSKQSFDYLYTRILSTGENNIQKLLYTLRRNMHKNSVVLFEIVILEGIQAFPYNHAICRTIELISLLNETSKTKVSKAEELIKLFHEARFEIKELHTSLPAFIPPTEKHLISLTLEVCKESILLKNYSTVEELNALLVEIREFESQEDTLISQPALIQIFACQATNKNFDKESLSD